MRAYAGTRLKVEELWEGEWRCCKGLLFSEFPKTLIEL
jgi:hypothetical protein